MFLNIITITKNNSEELFETIKSTEKLRSENHINQIVIDSSEEKIYQNNKTKLKNSRNVILVREKKLGISVAFNRGVKESTGTWVWFLNSGDIVNRNLDINQFTGLIRGSTSELVIFKIKAGNKISEWPPLHSLWPPVFNWISHPGLIINREFIIKVGKFNEKLKIAMDGDMWFRMFNNHARIDLIPITVSKFKLNGISQNKKQLSREVLYIIFLNFGIIIKRWFANIVLVFKAVIENFLILIK